jgi:peptidoglycan/xylan/chitin deacetylase (PgdA/CDA1 family)
MKRLVRRAALSALKSCGAFGLVCESAWRRRRLLILCYHGVALEDEDQWKPWLFVTPQVLERRLEILHRQNYAVLHLGEALERLYRNDLPARSVALTFDDGGYDFYKQAYPRLLRHEFPATVYLTSYYSELQAPVFHLMCSYLLWKARNRGSVDLKEFGVEQRVDLNSLVNRDEAIDCISQWAEREGMSGREKDQVAATLSARLGIDYENLRRKRILQLMNRSEIAELAARGIDFQLHTHRHRTPLQEELFRREIRENRALLESVVRGDRKHFCYPSGAYRPEFLPWLSEEGVISATTCDTGLATARSNPLLLPRLVDTGQRTELEFESWINGIGHFLSRRRRARLAYAGD